MTMDNWQNIEYVGYIILSIDFVQYLINLLQFR